MTDTIDISTQMFRTWEKDPVTRVVMRLLEKSVEEANEYMTNPHIIEQVDSRAKLHKMLGYVEGLNTILNIDLTTEEVNDEDNTNRV
mgnify:CR=1 FL=1|tara:strand:- start:1618 stop:1878 length:261 start_codon:yes stop_codon:yes gene_type:complete